MPNDFILIDQSAPVRNGLVTIQPTALVNTFGSIAASGGANTIAGSGVPGGGIQLTYQVDEKARVYDLNGPSASGFFNAGLNLRNKFHDSYLGSSPSGVI